MPLKAQRNNLTTFFDNRINTNGKCFVTKTSLFVGMESNSLIYFMAGQDYNFRCTMLRSVANLVIISLIREIPSSLTFHNLLLNKKYIRCRKQTPTTSLITCRTIKCRNETPITYPISGRRKLETFYLCSPCAFVCHNNHSLYVYRTTSNIAPHWSRLSMMDEYDPDYLSMMDEYDPYCLLPQSYCSCKSSCLIPT